jgi:hypothetical protein
MNKILVLTIFLMTPVFIHPQSTDGKIIVAVLDFVPSGISKSETVIFTDYVTSHVVSTRVYSVIDRATRNSLLSEIEFSLDDCTDEECQLEVGRLLSAKQIIVGSLGLFGDSYILNMRFVDIETSATINAVSGAYKSLSHLLDDSKRLTMELLDYFVVDSPIETQTTEIATSDNKEVVAESESTAVEPKPDKGSTVAIPLKKRSAIGTYRVRDGQIRVDGRNSDWMDVPLAYSDRQGDSKTERLDLKSVKTAMDSEYGYILIEIYAAFWPNDATAEVNIDCLEGITGFPGRYGDLHTNIRRGELNAWKSDSDKPGSEFRVGRYKNIIRRNVMEVAIPLSSIEKLGEVTHFNVTYVNLWLSHNLVELNRVPFYNNEN